MLASPDASSATATTSNEARREFKRPIQIVIASVVLRSDASDTLVGDPPATTAASSSFGLVAERKRYVRAKGTTHKNSPTRIPSTWHGRSQRSCQPMCR
jgi:hypothetical protein